MLAQLLEEEVGHLAGAGVMQPLHLQLGLRPPDAIHLHRAAPPPLSIVVRTHGGRVDRSGNVISGKANASGYVAEVDHDGTDRALTDEALRHLPPVLSVALGAASSSRASGLGHSCSGWQARTIRTRSLESQSWDSITAKTPRKKEGTPARVRSSVADPIAL